MQLKKIKYPYQIDDILIKSGDPRQYLPIFNYLLLEYSPLVSKSLLEKEYEFYSKNDKDFVKTILICLINYFGYKPSISCEQFFREGFAEAKIGFTIDFIGFIIKERDKLSKKQKERKKGSNKEKENINKVEYEEEDNYHPQTYQNESLEGKINNKEKMTTINDSNNYYNTYDNNCYQVDNTNKYNNLYIDDDIDKEDELIPNEDIYYINKPYQPNNKVSNQTKIKYKDKNKEEEEDISSLVSTITELVKSVNQMQVQLDKYIDTSNQKIVSMTERISIIERKYDDISSENYILKNEIFMLKKKD